LRRLEDKITGVIAYVLPLLASFPPMLGWAGLMTLPFIFFLTSILVRFAELPSSLGYLLLGGSALDVGASVLGLALLALSVVYMRSRKSSGLVISGPYRFVRHPQYLGLILFTASMTSRSVWMLTHTFGVGWLSLEQTVFLWYAMSVSYAIIAGVEELQLSKKFPDDWPGYREATGFMLPAVSTKNRAIETLILLVCFGLLLSVMIAVNP